MRWKGEAEWHGSRQHQRADIHAGRRKADNSKSMISEAIQKAVRDSRVTKYRFHDYIGTPP